MMPAVLQISHLLFKPSNISHNKLPVMSDQVTIDSML